MHHRRNRAYGNNPWLNFVEHTTELEWVKLEPKWFGDGDDDDADGCDDDAADDDEDGQYDDDGDGDDNDYQDGSQDGYTVVGIHYHLANHGSPTLSVH